MAPGFLVTCNYPTTLQQIADLPWAGNHAADSRLMNQVDMMLLQTCFSKEFKRQALMLAQEKMTGIAEFITNAALKQYLANIDTNTRRVAKLVRPFDAEETEAGVITEILAEHEMERDARGLAEFITDYLKWNVPDHNNIVVTDKDGRACYFARFVKSKTQHGERIELVLECNAEE